MTSSARKLATSFILILTLSITATSCRSSKSSVSAVEKWETVSQGSDRFQTFHLADSLSCWLSLSADSIVIWSADVPVRISDTADWQQLSACTDSAATAHYNPTAQSPKPTALKIYGLQVDERITKQAEVHSSLQDSTAISVQSYERKEDKIQKERTTAPLHLKVVFYLLLTVFSVYIIYRLRR